MTTVNRAKPRHWPHLPGSWLLCLVLLPALAVVTTAGCGDEGGSGSSSNKPATRRPPTPKKPGGQRGKNDKSGALDFYPKIENFAADNDERRSLRRPFDPLEDFTPDSEGLRNRDPFRSYIVRQPGREIVNTGDQPKQTDSCDKKEHVASGFPLRELQLVGIVLRGTQSYALFRDSATYGHIVRKGDCLGQEKAKVVAIRAGFVSLQVIPENAGEDTAPQPQDRVIPLYPDEYIPDTAP